MDQLKDILTMFGVTWGKFLAQVFIFLIVYLVLKKFAFGPVMAMLDERKRRIQEGEENLEKIKRDLDEAEAKTHEIIDVANKKSERMIEDARESAETFTNQQRQEAVHEANQIIAKAKEAGRLEQEQMASELKREFGRLVIDTTSKVSGKVLDQDDQERINRETAGQIAL